LALFLDEKPWLYLGHTNLTFVWYKRAEWPVWCSTVRTYFTTVVMTANTDVDSKKGNPIGDVIGILFLKLVKRS
jgi:hypothetical protein